MGFFWSQLFVTPAYPKASFEGKTAIITGSNVGLGLEAARHITRLGAKKVILAVRNLTAGEQAKTEIETSTNRPGVCEVWKLDLGSYESVKAFATKAQGLDRVDVLLENAGIATRNFALAEGSESTVTVNVISTFLLAFLMLPKLEETAQKFNTRSHLTIVSSEVHAMAKFRERNSQTILSDLSDEKKTDMGDRYNVSKLLEVLVIRQIRDSLAQSKNKDVILNYLNPGLCHSSLGREMPFIFQVFKFFLARTTEVGGRTLVHGTTAGPESHGKYMTDGLVADEALVAWVRSEEGDRVGAQVWKEVKAKLESIEPGVTKNVE